ncbi:MAG: type II secretion system protein [Microcoleus sp. SIO2G3]|nr:type II secretion system protein [Microcoleus sp. SIO2G3]
MLSSIALKRLGRSKQVMASAKPELSQQKRLYLQSQLGYTLIEMLVVIIIISVLAAIAAPGWLSFTNQRRVTAVNGAVLRALQEAQSNAKKAKVSYSVSFESEPGKTPRIAVYQTYVPNDSTPRTPSAQEWKDLGDELGLKPGQIALGTNLTGENKAGNTFDYELNGTDNNKKITFDYLGVLPPDSQPDLDVNNDDNPEGLVVTEAAAKSGNSNDPLTSNQKCVKVITLLGSQLLGKNTECNL